MRFLVPLLCLCGAAVMADDPFLSVLSFSTHLTNNADKYGVKPEVAEASDLKAELEHWNADEDKPAKLVFLDDDGKPQEAKVEDAAQFVNFAAAPSYEDRIKFYYFNKIAEKREDDKLGRTSTGTEFTIDKVQDLRDWDSSLPLKVVIHGFGNTVRSPVIADTAQAYLKAGKYNVIGVDWGQLCALPNYFSARAHVAPTGTLVGRLVDKIIEAKMADPEKIHLIGHSLGAHVAGIAGKSLEHGPVARITGLDPAGPLFWFTKADGRLDYTDAKLVDVIHSNAGLYGKSIALGHVDFYVNGGQSQPNCADDIVDACSHGRAVDMFVDTIRTGRGYQGDLCGRLPGRSRSTCKSVYKATMGNDVQYSRQGTYYVDPLNFPKGRDVAQH